MDSVPAADAVSSASAYGSNFRTSVCAGFEPADRRQLDAARLAAANGLAIVQRMFVPLVTRTTAVASWCSVTVPPKSAISSLCTKSDGVRRHAEPGQLRIVAPPANQLADRTPHSDRL